MSAQFNPSFDKTKHQLFLIFTHYCSFADRDNYNKLKIQNFRRMLEDAQILKHSHDHIRTDLIFSGKKKTDGIDFDTFLGTIPQLVKKDKYIDQNDVKDIIDNNFHALYEYLRDETQFGKEILTIQKTVFTEPCFLYLKNYSSTLFQIYSYFFDPLKVKVLKEKTDIFKALNGFTKDYEIIPHLVSKNYAYMAMNYLLELKAHCVYEQWFKEKKYKTECPFTFFIFLQFIVMLSNVSIKKIHGFQLSPVRKVAALLDRMEVSKGFSNLCNKQKITTHLIASEQKIQQLQKNDIFIESLRSSPIKKRSKNQNQDEQANKLLKSKFMRFCLEGETLGKSVLTHKKVMKIFQGLGSQIPKSQLEVMMSRKSHNSIDFETFLELLESSALEEGVEFGRRVQDFMRLSDQIGQMSPRKQQLNFGTKEEYEKAYQMIEFVSNFLHSIFIFETTNGSPSKTSALSIQQYIKTMHDFQVIPYYLTKADAISVFEECDLENTGSMNFIEFKRSFLTCLKYLQNNPNQGEESIQKKLMVVLEKMNDSRGKKHIVNVSTGSTDFMREFRKKFHQFYIQKSDKQFSHADRLKAYLQ